MALSALPGPGIQATDPIPPPGDAMLLPLPASHNFCFLGHPGAWDVILAEDGPAIVPRLRELRYEPGVACVSEVKGSFDGSPKMAISIQQGKGWILIPPDRPVVAHGETYTRYVNRFAGQKGPVHLSVWYRPYVRGGRVIQDFDEKGWHRFLRDLVGTVIPAPDKEALRALELDMRQEWQRHATLADKNARSAAMAELYERKLEVFKTPVVHSRAPAPVEAPAPAPALEHMFAQMMEKLQDLGASVRTVSEQQAGLREQQVALAADVKATSQRLDALEKAPANDKSSGKAGRPPAQPPAPAPAQAPAQAPTQAPAQAPTNPPKGD